VRLDVVRVWVVAKGVVGGRLVAKGMEERAETTLGQ